MTCTHSTDDLGYPINPFTCPACSKRMDVMNDRFIEGLFQGIDIDRHIEPRTDPAEEYEGEREDRFGQ